MNEIQFTRVVKFDILNTFKHITKASGYSFPIGHTEAVLIRRPTPLFASLKTALTSDELKAIKKMQRKASRRFDTYIYVAFVKDEFEVFKCESEDKEEIIVSAFKEWCAQQGWKF